MKKDLDRDHPCAAPRCSVIVPGYMLACGPHWHALPEPLQSQIRRAWQRRRRNPHNDGLAMAHLQFVTEAMEIWIS